MAAGGPGAGRRHAGARPPSDSVPTSLRDQTTLAGALGYREEDDEGPAGQLLQDYRQATRRARAVMERVFYDD